MENQKITLVDDEGKETEFELVVTFDVGDDTYAILAGEDSEDAFPVKINEGEDGETILIPVESDEEFEMVSEAYDALNFGEEE